jgi:hypothetical protein
MTTKNDDEKESRVRRRFRVVLTWKKVYNFGIIEATSKSKAKEYAEDKLYDDVIDHKETEEYQITELSARSKNGRKK